MVVLVLVLGMVALGAVDPEARHVVPELDPGGGGGRFWTGQPARRPLVPFDIS